MSAGGTGVACEAEVLRSLDRLPPFSPVLNRLVATLAQEDVSFGALAAIIEKDTVLAGNVLRLVNSALYGFQGTVNSVRHAVAILGLVKLRNVVMGMSISRLWRNVRTPPEWSPARFNMHSVAAAILSDLLAQRLPAPYPEGAFVAGLLHDLGKLLVAISMPREYSLIQVRLAARGGSIEDYEREVIGTTHSALSGAALAKWHLPQPIQRAVAFHHAPDQANQGQLDLSHIVHVADLLAIDLGQSLRPAEEEPRRGAEQVVAELGLADQLPDLVAQFGPEFEVMRAFF